MPNPILQSLCDARWTLVPVGDSPEVPTGVRLPIPARVPGCVHTDLMTAALIRDPAIGFNELEQQWIGRTDWECRCRFESDPELWEHERIDLACDGLDTIATVTLNGVEIGHAANMFHPHRFDARAALRNGDNELVIRFAAPLHHIREEEVRIGARPVNGDWDAYIFIRKAACNFGWDWGPRVATCGIWKPIRLEGWSGVRIAAVRPLVRREEGDQWRIDVAVELEWSGSLSARPMRLGVSLRDTTSGRLPMDVSASLELGGIEREVSLTLAADKPQLWWPRGYGLQPRYDLRVFINEAGDAPGLGPSWSARIGFREIRLDTAPDEVGSPFTLLVNGTPLFCKGANWVPEGLFPAQLTRENYRERLQQSADANMNTLRVWGGGIYESDDFYDLCDELGILVWQDFMFACAMYPEEAPYPALVETEARHQITRLSSHPSVALWCGGNECVWAYESWGSAAGETATWKQRVGDKTWGRGYYFDLLPRLMAELDPTRPYWANSPWSGSENVAPNDANHGDRHTWEVRGDGRRTIVPRFCSEFGHQGPASYVTLARTVGVAELAIGSRGLEHRQRATGGTAKHIDDAIAESFRPPRNFDEWHYLAQLVQARSLRTGIEWMRVNQPRCMGALVWQLNDAWPGLSWSLIDSDGRPKPAWHAVRTAFENRLLTIQPLDGRLLVCVVNDTDQTWESRLDLSRMAFDGTVLAGVKGRRFTVEPRSVARIADVEELVGTPGDPTRELIVADTIKRRRHWFYLPDKELDYPEPRFDARGRYTPGGVLRTRCVARTLIRDAVFMTDRLASCELERPVEVFTLLPGDTFECGAKTDGRMGTTVPMSTEVLTRRPVFWCANWFGRLTP